MPAERFVTDGPLLRLRKREGIGTSRRLHVGPAPDMWRSSRTGEWSRRGEGQAEAVVEKGWVAARCQTAGGGFAHTSAVAAGEALPSRDASMATREASRGNARVDRHTRPIHQSEAKGLTPGILRQGTRDPRRSSIEAVQRSRRGARHRTTCDARVSPRSRKVAIPARDSPCTPCFHGQSGLVASTSVCSWGWQ